MKWRGGFVRRIACLSAVGLLTGGCVRWQAVSPTADASMPLPRWVRVTTRDSSHYLLERAAFRHDTLVGRASDEPGIPAARIPAGDIAHLEAREPSLAGSLGVTTLVLGSVIAFCLLLAYATPT